MEPRSASTTLGTFVGCILLLLVSSASGFETALDNDDVNGTWHAALGNNLTDSWSLTTTTTTTLEEDDVGQVVVVELATENSNNVWSLTGNRSHIDNRTWEESIDSDLSSSSSSTTSNETVSGDALPMPTTPNSTVVIEAEDVDDGSEWIFNVTDNNDTTTTTVSLKASTSTEEGVQSRTHYNDEEEITTVTTITDTTTEVDAATANESSSTSDVVLTHSYSTTDAAAATCTWFVLVLDGNCSISDGDLERLRDGVEAGITGWFDVCRRDVAIRNTSCSSPDQMHVNVTAFLRPGLNVSALLASLEDLGHPLVRIENHDYYVYKILTPEGFIVREPDIPVDMRHSDVELVIYLAVGSTCAFLLVLVAGLLFCKYWDGGKSTRGVPVAAASTAAIHSNVNNLHLEDYTLTRIPRPKLGYADCYRGLTACSRRPYSPLDDKLGIDATRSSGLVQPFDTSVVPLEDARAMDDHKDGVIVRPSDFHRRFGRSLSRIYRSGRNKIVGRPTCHHQHLHRSDAADKASNDDGGLDNPAFQ